MNGETITLTIPSIMDYMNVVVDVVESFARMKKLSEEKISRLRSAVAEACVNAIEHGNKLDPDKQVVLNMSCEDTLLRVSIKDCGEGHQNPSFEMPDVGAQIEQRELSGWGMYLISTFVDKVEVDAVPSEGTTTTMIMYY